MFANIEERIAQADALLARTEERRERLFEHLEAKEARSELGQFFTPLPVAKFIAGLLDLPSNGTFRLLDPGAGIGSLTAARAAGS